MVHRNHNPMPLTHHNHNRMALFHNHNPMGHLNLMGHNRSYRLMVLHHNHNLMVHIRLNHNLMPRIRLNPSPMVHNLSRMGHNHNLTGHNHNPMVSRNRNRRTNRAILMPQASHRLTPMVLNRHRTLMARSKAPTLTPPRKLIPMLHKHNRIRTANSNRSTTRRRMDNNMDARGSEFTRLAGIGMKRVMFTAIIGSLLICEFDLMI
jgi:hypothetical protein